MERRIFANGILALDGTHTCGDAQKQDGCPILNRGFIA